NNDNKVVIARAGAIPPLVERVKYGNAVGRVYAAGAHGNLASNNPDNVAPESHAVILAIPDERMGHAIALIREQGKTEALPRKRFDQMVRGFERIAKVISVPSIPKTALGKVRWAALRDLIPT
ncbi:MAG: hypothetical protein AAF191_19940, partial [Verrucomicrobiota bacterium]